MSQRRLAISFRHIAFCFPLLAFCLLLCAEASADNSGKIQKAIDSGVKYLKSAEVDVRSPVGAFALLGLTLLECGVPADDPAVLRAASTVRQASVDLTHTYSVSLAIMFLDRLGDPMDVRLIQSLGVRLVNGQSAAGGWSYSCPAVDEEEARRLTAVLNAQPEQNQKPAPGARRERPKLPDELTERVNRMEHKGRRGNRANVLGGDDNSNTQFAILGLWIARRHGVPVEKALALVEQHFRRSQNADGGWGYHTGSFMTHSTPAMTCAGLLGLAMAYGSANEAILHSAQPGEGKRAPKPATPKNPGRDPAVISGLKCLAVAIGMPAHRGAAAPAVPPQDLGGRMYYFLWSLERVAVAYDLKTIGKKDWYAWGAEVLLAKQAGDGSWTGDFGGPVDTAFALLFLRRANLAGDLTASMKGRAKELGEATLTAVAPALGELPKIAHAVPKEIPLDDETAKLRDELINAPADRRDELLDRFKDAKGVAYTQALAAAIPQLAAASQGKARDALAERLMRMNATTLRERLRDSDIEMRVAAARACAGKEEPVHVPDLITLLEDREPVVVRAARSALKHLSRGKDYGPADETSAAERGRAVDAWKKWWAEQRR